MSGKYPGVILVAGLALVFATQVNLNEVMAESSAERPGSVGELEGVWKGRDRGNLRSVWTLEVKGDEFRFKGPGPYEWYEGTLTLHPGSPTGIDLRILRCDCTYLDSTSLGLYELADRSLTFVGAEPGYERPERLDLTSGHSLQMDLTRIPAPG